MSKRKPSTLETTDHGPCRFCAEGRIHSRPRSFGRWVECTAGCMQITVAAWKDGEAVSEAVARGLAQTEAKGRDDE